MPGTYIPGYKAKLTLNGVVFGFESATADPEADSLRTTNSEGYNGTGGAVPDTPGIHTSITGNILFRATFVQASWDSSASPFALPINLVPGQFVTLQLWPNTRLGGYWYCGSFQITRSSHNIQVVGNQPINFSGQGNGYFLLPLAP